MPSFSSLTHWVRGRLVPCFAIVGVAAALHGCCSSTEEDVCVLVDYGEACPGSDEAEERWGFEVVDGPKEALFRDDRTQALGDVNGALCCYRAKFDYCSSPRVY